jgi:type 1 fimbria pilin
VSVKFESVSGDSGVDSVLGSTGTATGVGVQLLDASQAALPLGVFHVLTPSTTGDAVLVFYARYYRLASPLTVGPVKASAIVTMSYQ